MTAPRETTRRPDWSGPSGGLANSPLATEKWSSYDTDGDGRRGAGTGKQMIPQSGGSWSRRPAKRARHWR